MAKPKRFLKNIKVNFISLVDKGANQKEIVYKNDSDESNIKKTIQIKKYDSEKGIVYGIVYSPEQLDTDNDFTSAEEIEKMAFEFMKNGKTDKVDTQHNFKENGSFVVESWITKSGDAIFSGEPVGSWAVGIKVENEELKKSIKDGEITGLSMAGLCEVEVQEDEIEKADKKTFVQIIKEAFASFTKDFNSEYKNEQMRQMVWALTDSIRNTLNNAEIIDKKSVILNDIEQFKTAVTGTEIAKSNNSNKNSEAIIMTPEQIQEIVKQAVNGAVNPLVEQIAELKKSVEPVAEIEKRLKAVEDSPVGSQQIIEAIEKKRKETSPFTPMN